MRPGRAQRIRLYVVDAGTASVQVTRSGRSSIEVKMVGRGEVIGELSLVDNEPRSADVVAVTNLQAYQIDRIGFDRMRAALNPAAFKMLRRIAITVSARLREINAFAAGGIDSEARKPANPTDAGRPSLGWRRVFSAFRRDGS